ncbi:hypothetical protein BGX24_006385 [Mortierella sp. AD032]|nr:hypothetical protein BGX24_006385 [Mortierella sp. AD032]
MSTRRRHVRTHATTRSSRPSFQSLLLQICFLICTTVLTLTSTTNAYPLRLLTNDDDFNNNSATTPSVAKGSSTDDAFGKLILDVGQKTVLTTSNWILGTLLIITGLVQVFYGFKFIRLTLVLTGFISWAVVTMMITVILSWDKVYFLFKPSHYYFWLWFLAGILGAILSFRYWDLGVAFAGGFGGFALAMGIIAAINDAHNITNTGRYIILAVLILSGASIAIFYERFAIILGTSLGGAFIFMFGVDEFLQAGYREMLVIFKFAGKTLQYRPDRDVFIMIGCSLVLACLGIAWEYWHHAKPLMVDRRALFRIYGRPFGKRPHKLAGQRLKRKVAQSDWYSYLAGCLCLRKRTAEEVLFDEDEGYDENAAVAAGAGAETGSTTATTSATVEQCCAHESKTGSTTTTTTTTSESALETVVIVVEESNVQDPNEEEKLDCTVILPGTEVIYGSGIESPIHSGSSSTLTTTQAAAEGPVEIVFSETSESIDENGARIVTTTTTTTTATSSSEGGYERQHQEQYQQHYLSSSEETSPHSESTYFQQTNSTESGHAEMMVRTESSSSSSGSAHMSASRTTTTAERSMETSTSNTGTGRTLLQSVATAHQSLSSRTTTTTTTNESGTTTVVSSHSSSSS